ncbi:MAG: DUF6265 family protein [Planctomycetota bacterium]
MRRLLLASALPLLSAASPRAVHPSPAGFRVESLAWMAGAWREARGNGSSEEHWIAPAGGLMLGVNRQIAGGKAAFFEFLRIEQRGEEVYYVAQPKGRAGTDFKQVGGKENEALFENPEHDFPRRLLYRREADDSLFARAEGEEGGKTRVLEYRWKPDPPR